MSLVAKLEQIRDGVVVLWVHIHVSLSVHIQWNFNQTHQFHNFWRVYLQTTPIHNAASPYIYAAKIAKCCPNVGVSMMMTSQALQCSSLASLWQCSAMAPRRWLADIYVKCTQNVALVDLHCWHAERKAINKELQIGEKWSHFMGMLNRSPLNGRSIDAGTKVTP